MSSLKVVLSMTAGTFAGAIPLWRASLTFDDLKDSYITAASCVLIYAISLLLLSQLISFAGGSDLAVETYGSIAAIVGWPLIVSKMYDTTMLRAGELTWKAMWSLSCVAVCMLYVIFDLWFFS